ncbi:unnamed protein product, partial [Candidula unifasciata]
MFEAVVSIAALLCLVLVVLGCLDCLFKKKQFEAFEIRDGSHAQHNAAFSVDIFDADNISDQVIIEPLPDILSKVAVAPILRPRMTCTERGKQEATLSLLSVQRSFPRNRVTYLKEIGSGWFGKAIESEAVHIVTESDASHVVVKMLKDDASKLEQKQFMEEVNAFRCLEHANLLSFFGQCTETTPFLVILEFAAHGNLKSYLMKHRHDVDSLIASNRLVSFALGAASGLACLHRHDYIHNDLAARNCLVMSDYTLKIGDYGISDSLFKDEYFNTGSELLPVRWMAPETLVQMDGVWTSQKSNKMSDMWSFGILLWEICSLGEHPYDCLTDEGVLQNVVQDRLILPADVNLNPKLPFKVKMWSVMIQCWEEPSERLQVEQAHRILEQLKINSDVISGTSDFDQKWNHLQPNQEKKANISVEHTSALANTTVVDFHLEKPSFFSSEIGMPDGVKRDDVILEIDSYLTPVSSSRDLAVPKSSVQHVLTSADHTLSRIEQNGSFSASPCQVIQENEVKRMSTPLNHDRPDVSLEQQMIDGLLVASKGSVSASQFYSPHSSPSSEYITVDEMRGHSGIQDDTLKELSIADGDLSLDSEGLSIHESIDDTLKDSFSPGENSIGNNNNILFILPFHEREDDFSDFVQTSPEHHDISCTDFEPYVPTAVDSLVQTNGVHEDELCNNNAFILENNMTSSDGFCCTDDVFSELVPYVDSITHVNSDRNEFSDLHISTSPFDVDGVNSISGCSNLFDRVNSYDAIKASIEESSKLSNLQVYPEVKPLSDSNQDVFISAQDHNFTSSALLVPGLEIDESGSSLDMADASREMLSAEAVISNQYDDQSAIDNQMESISLPSNVSDSTCHVSSDNTDAVHSVSLLQSESFADSHEHLESVNREKLPHSFGIIDDHNECNSSFNLVKTENGHADSPSEQLRERILSDYSDVHGISSLKDSDKLIVQEEVSTSRHIETESVDSSIHSSSMTEGPTNYTTNNTEVGLSDSSDYIQETALSETCKEGDDDEELDEGPSAFQSNLYRCSRISLTEDPEDAADESSNFKSVDIHNDHCREDSQSPVDSESEDAFNSNFENEQEYISDEAISGPPQTSSPDNTAIDPDSDTTVSPEPSSPVDFDEQALQIASEIYLSRGLKSPRVFEILPLETIPEHPPMPDFHEESNYTPSETSSLDVRYEEMFGGDSFEWDDFYGDSLIGKDLSLQHSSHQQNSVREYDVSDWSMDIDSESIASGASPPSQSEETTFSQPMHLPSQSSISVYSDISTQFSLSSVLSPLSKSTDSSRETLVSSLLSQLQSPIIMPVSSANQKNFYSLMGKYSLETDSSLDGLASPPMVMTSAVRSSSVTHATPLSPPASPPFSPLLPSGQERSVQQIASTSPVSSEQSMRSS